MRIIIRLITYNFVINSKRMCTTEKIQHNDKSSHRHFQRLRIIRRFCMWVAEKRKQTASFPLRPKKPLQKQYKKKHNRGDGKTPTAKTEPTRKSRTLTYDTRDSPCYFSEKRSRDIGRLTAAEQHHVDGHLAQYEHRVGVHFGFHSILILSRMANVGRDETRPLPAESQRVLNQTG